MGEQTKWWLHSMISMPHPDKEGERIVGFVVDDLESDPVSPSELLDRIIGPQRYSANQSDRDQVADLLLSDPQSGQPCVIVSTLRTGPGGFMSFDVQSGPQAPKWTITVRVSEASAPPDESAFSLLGSAFDGGADAAIDPREATP